MAKRKVNGGYVAISPGGAPPCEPIYGCGSTEESALEDAAYWAGKFAPDRYRVIPASLAVMDRLIKDGGAGFLWEIDRDGVAQLIEE